MSAEPRSRALVVAGTEIESRTTSVASGVERRSPSVSIEVVFQYGTHDHAKRLLETAVAEVLAQIEEVEP